MDGWYREMALRCRDGALTEPQTLMATGVAVNDEPRRDGMVVVLVQTAHEKYRVKTRRELGWCRSTQAATPTCG